jgi:hypothetical protein
VFIPIPIVLDGMFAVQLAPRSERTASSWAIYLAGGILPGLLFAGLF